VWWARKRMKGWVVVACMRWYGGDEDIHRLANRCSASVCVCG